MVQIRLLPQQQLAIGGRMHQRQSKPIDGRRERSVRTKERLVKAFIRLFCDTRQYPTAEEVALVAGYSSRSLFEQFGTLRELELAAFDAMLTHCSQQVSAETLEFDLRDRSAIYVASRALLCEKWLPLWRLLSRLCGTLEAIDARMTAARKRARVDLLLVYGPELALLTEAERGIALTVIEALLDFESWSRMRDIEKMTHGQACTAWLSAIHWILGAPTSATGTNP